MIRVSELEFNQFLKGKSYKKIQAEYIHADYYADENGDIIAYKETSSWNPDIIYKIKSDFANQETSNFLTNFINKI